MPHRLLREEARCFSQDLPLLTQHTVLPLKLTQPRALIRRQPRALTPINTVLGDPFVNVCGAMPSSRANSLIDRSPDRAKRIASTRNSGGYGGRVLPIMDSLQEASAPNHQVSIKTRQLQRNFSSVGIADGLPIM